MFLTELLCFMAMLCDPIIVNILEIIANKWMNIITQN